MKSARAIALALIASAPLLAQAAVSPGQYSVGGIQQICLVSDGTWYGTSFSGWGGHWQTSGKSAYIYGNYASGVGNDSMVFKKGTGTWTEWRDDLSFEMVMTGSTLTKLSSTCSPPALQGMGSSDGNPAR